MKLFGIKLPFVKKDKTHDFGRDSEEINFEMIVSLEEFVIGNYVNQMTILSILVDKGIITIDEFLAKKEEMKNEKDIKNLYEELKNKKDMVTETIDLEDLLNGE